MKAEELSILEKTDLATIMLRQVKELFVFSCYTGLAYIDDIMEKFKSENNVAIRETIFPRISNQEVNRSLKIIAVICGIQKYLTFHWLGIRLPQ